MLVPFSSLPDHARVWIYPASRLFTEIEKEEISRIISQFLNQWATHGTPLKTAFDLPYDRFIVIGLDEEVQGASGCSIDASVKFIQELETEYKVDLMDKMNVSYKQGEYIAYKSLTDFKKMAKDKAVSKNTIVFNNLVNTKAEYLEFWEVPASESWHSRFV